MQGNSHTPVYPLRVNFLSEYDSYESQSQSARGRHSSARIMRKLKQLWNRQRYLTDDEIESGRETHRDEGGRRGLTPRESQPEARDLIDQDHSQKPLHARQLSSEEEQMNLVRKKSNRHTVQSQQPSRESKQMEELQQIAAFNSQVEDGSK